MYTWGEREGEMKRSSDKEPSSNAPLNGVNRFRCCQDLPLQLLSRSSASVVVKIFCLSECFIDKFYSYCYGLQLRHHI